MTPAAGSGIQPGAGTATRGVDMPPAVPSGPVSPFKLASVLLQYPTTALFEGLSHLAAAAAGSPRASREAFGRFLAWLAATPPDEVVRHYVETFDLRRRCALYLTYYRYGDTRKRGMAPPSCKNAACSNGAPRSSTTAPSPPSPATSSAS